MCGGVEVDVVRVRNQESCVPGEILTSLILMGCFILVNAGYDRVDIVR